MANSKIKQILVGNTTYDIEDTGAVHLSTKNTFTDKNIFSKNVIINDSDDKGPVEDGSGGGSIGWLCFNPGGAPEGSDITLTTSSVAPWSAISYNKIKYKVAGETGDAAIKELQYPTKSGTLALTSDIDVTAAGNNTLTGTNIFTGSNTFDKPLTIKPLEISSAYFATKIENNQIATSFYTSSTNLDAFTYVKLLCDSAVPSLVIKSDSATVETGLSTNCLTMGWHDSNYQLCASDDSLKLVANYKPNSATTSVTKTLIFPVNTAGEGTLAIADDDSGSVIQFKENTYIGSKCSLTRDVTTWINSGYGSYCSPGFLVAGFGSGNSSNVAGTTAIGPDGIYKIGTTANRLKFTLPDEAGTLVTTAGSNTFTGDNTFTGTNTFKVTSAANYVKISSTGVRIHSDVGASPDVVLFSDYPERLCVKSGSSRSGYIQFPAVDNTIKNVETLALLRDIPIKTATLSGTTLSITLS